MEKVPRVFTYLYRKWILVKVEMQGIYKLLRTDLMLCYKIFDGLVLLSSDDFFTTVRNRATRGHSFKLFLSDSRVNCRQHFFAVRIVLLQFGTRYLMKLFQPTH